MNVHDATEEAYKNGYDAGLKKTNEETKRLDILDLLSKITVVLFLVALITLFICGIVFSLNGGEIDKDFDYAYIGVGTYTRQIEVESVQWVGDNGVIITDIYGKLWYTTRDNVVFSKSED